MKKQNLADNEKLNVQGGGEFATFALEEVEDDKAMKTSLIGAIGFHAVLLLINFPALHSEPQAVEEKPKVVFVMQQTRFEPPTPRRRTARRPASVLAARERATRRRTSGSAVGAGRVCDRVTVVKSS